MMQNIILSRNDQVIVIGRKSDDVEQKIYKRIVTSKI